jgi:hypothetical protein
MKKIHSIGYPADPFSHISRFYGSSSDYGFIFGFQRFQRYSASPFGSLPHFPFLFFHLPRATFHDHSIFPSAEFISTFCELFWAVIRFSALHVPELGDDLSAILFAIIFSKLFRNG